MLQNGVAFKMKTVYIFSVLPQSKQSRARPYIKGKIKHYKTHYTINSKLLENAGLDILTCLLYCIWVYTPECYIDCYHSNTSQNTHHQQYILRHMTRSIKLAIDCCSKDNKSHVGMTGKLGLSVLSTGPLEQT